jgi:diketogulonate reductase-like aldo/keto reductase
MAFPTMIYGTAWKEERTEALTTAALRAGFRAIDTANQRRHYVEAAVGAAVAGCVRDGVVTRAELFLQTKFTHVDGQDHRLPFDASAPIATQVAQSLASSLEHLGTSYVDAYLLHGPSLHDGLADDDWEAWHAIVAEKAGGRVRAVGVSNVAPAHLEPLCRDGMTPVFVQNRCYAQSGWDHDVRALCRAHGIVYQGFSLLTANRRQLGGPVVARIAERHGRTVAQVAFRFAIQLGIVPLTGTSDGAHMRHDLACAEFALGDDEVEAIMAATGR